MAPLPFTLSVAWSMRLVSSGEVHGPTGDFACSTPTPQPLLEKYSEKSVLPSALGTLIMLGAQEAMIQGAISPVGMRP